MAKENQMNMCFGTIVDGIVTNIVIMYDVFGM